MTEHNELYPAQNLPHEPRPEEPPPRAPYTPPRLERLGEWSALTLQQSIPVFP